ncbi:MAG: hypothetical protein Q8936_22930 [Bacillota bacterium]|nr:hypothetical protein [Bacillota bacterium]
MNKIIVDYRILSEEKNTLYQIGYDSIECTPCSTLYNAVCGHPDMLMHFVDATNVVVHKNMHSNFIDTLKNLGFDVHFSKNELCDKYPFDISLNAVNLSNHFIHLLNYTDETLLSLIQNKKLINVKQGYTKCSTAVVSDNAIITSDKSIAKALKNEDSIDVLLIPPGDITLPGLDYGFIGGCCGLLDKETMAFYGDLNFYKYGDEVIKFLFKHNVKPLYLRKGKLIDRGTLICLDAL